MSNFSSLFEFLAAVYVSMYFEGIFDFWNVKYKSNLETAIREHDWTNTAVFRDSLNNHKNKWYEAVCAIMKNRAAYMIAFIITLLIIIGFTGESPNESMKCSICTMSLLSIVLTTTPINRFVFLKFKWCLLTLFFVLTSAIASSLYYEVLPVELKEFTSSYYIISVVIACLLPAVIQLVISWLYSAPYASLLKAKMGAFGTLYNKATLALSSHNYEGLPSEFQQLLTETLVKEGKDSFEDSSLRKYNNLLQEKLLDICMPQHALVIFLSWVKFQMAYAYNFVVSKFMGSDDADDVSDLQKGALLPKEYQVHKDVKRDYSKDYELYKKEKKEDASLNLRRFASRHGLHYQPFVNWVKENKPR